MNAIVARGSVRRTSVTTVVLLIIGAAIAASVASCAFVSHTRNSAFEAVQVGVSERSVLDLFGSQPSVREKPGVLFARYASEPCAGPCVERIWFENRLSLDTEAWSIELDQDRHVVKKSRWVSP